MAAVGNVVVFGRAAAGAAAELTVAEGKEVTALGGHNLMTAREGIVAVSAAGELSDAVAELAATMHLTGVAHGKSHSVAVTHLGSVYTWGEGSQGQLGQPKLAA
jgi:hypothetical protein